MNLITLFTSHGPVHVDTAQLARLGRTRLTMYTATGKKLSEVGRTKEIRERSQYGVHRDNLYASQALADAATDRLLAELFPPVSNQGEITNVA